MGEKEYIEDNIIEDGYYVFCGDYIKSITINGNEISFIYVLSGQYLRDKNGDFVRSKENTGIEYIETYKYNGISSKNVIIDGKETTIFYHDIDFTTNIKDVYSNDFNLNRLSKIAQINNMKVNDVWSEKDNINQSPIFKNENLMGFSDAPKYDIDVVVERGGVTVNEKFFKLGECNTFEDLENYGNDYFGLNN